MSRLIDADLIQYEPMLLAKGNRMYEEVMVAYKSQIDDLPTIEERKKGKWIHNSDPMAGEGYWYCSECRSDTYTCFDFCPNCGADMRGNDNETD